ncbi:hypothetical protein PO124_24270 [Bacillus licheniformis]|nr:hypothetical protein [Bacillus licheniformis]
MDSITIPLDVEIIACLFYSSFIWHLKTTKKETGHTRIEKLSCEGRITVTFIILMAGLFLLIQLKRPFRRKCSAMFLAVYLTALALYTINSALFTSYLTAFVDIGSDCCGACCLPAF